MKGKYFLYIYLIIDWALVYKFFRQEQKMLRSDYIILRDLELVVEYHSGSFTLEGLINFRKKQFLDKNFSSAFNILDDLRNVEFVGSPADVNEYVNFYLENSYMMGDRNVAILTSTPNQVFYSTLFEQNNAKLRQQSKVFSTISAAHKWLNINISEEKLSEIIQELKKRNSFVSAS